jgi:hypothetical protein
MQRAVDPILPSLFLVGLVAVVLGNPDPLARDALCQSSSICFRSAHAAFWNSLIYEFGLGSVVSVIFYWLLVKLPDHAKKRRLRNHLTKGYHAFRREAVLTLLFASGEPSVDYDLVDELTPQSAFRNYFKQNSVKVNGDKWHDVQNNIKDHQIRDLFTALTILRDDILYVLNNTEIADQSSFDFLQRLSKAIFSHDPASVDYDDGKALFGFLWSLMSGWNAVKGYQPEDPIYRIIRRI